MVFQIVKIVTLATLAHFRGFLEPQNGLVRKSDFREDLSSIMYKWLFFKPKLSDSHRATTANVDSLRAGINPAPTRRVGEPFVGAGFTPARCGFLTLYFHK